MFFIAQSITADVYQLAGAYQLGAPREEYRFKMMRTLIGGLIMLALGVSSIVFIIISEHISLATMDFSAVDTSGAFWVFVLFGLALLALGIMSLLSLFQNFDLRVIVCEHGLVRTKKRQTEVVRWEHVNAFWQSVTKRYTNGIYTGTTHLYTLRRTDGAVIKFNDTIN